MKTCLKLIPVCLLATAMLTTFSACGDDTTEAGSTVANDTSDTSDTDEEESSIVDENAATTTVEGTGIALTYNEDVPANLAETIVRYFYAIWADDYDTYYDCVNPTYRDAMEEALQENYGYGIDEDFNSFREALTEYAGTEDYTITAIDMGLAQEVLADQYDSDTDFVGDYLTSYESFFGDGFIDTIEEKTTAIYDIAFTMYAVDGDGNDITMIDSMEILVAEEDGAYGIFD